MLVNINGDHKDPQYPVSYAALTQLTQQTHNFVPRSTRLKLLILHTRQKCGAAPRNYPITFEKNTSWSHPQPTPQYQPSTTDIVEGDQTLLHHKKKKILDIVHPKTHYRHGGQILCKQRQNKHARLEVTLRFLYILGEAVLSRSTKVFAVPVQALLRHWLPVLRLILIGERFPLNFQSLEIIVIFGEVFS